MKESIIVFGRGKYYHTKERDIKEKYNVIGFFDSSIKEGEMERDNDLPVHSPNDWETVLKNNKVLIAVLQWFPLYEQLVRLNFPKEKIILGLLEGKPYDAHEQLLMKRNCTILVTKNDIMFEDQGIKFLIHSEEDYMRVLRLIYKDEYSLIDGISHMSFEPSSRSWGSERGQCIDRVYIERFLEKHSKCIQGICMELGSDTYIKRYGANVEKSIVLHIYGKGRNAIKGNFETGEGLEDNSVDCLICTQAMTAIYDLKSSFTNIYKMLRPGGVALFTVSGAGGSPVSMSDYNNWGVYWRFTDMSLRRLLEEVFDKDKIEVNSYGNAKVEMGIQYGLCAEDLSPKDFDYYDEKYPLIITAVARK